MVMLTDMLSFSPPAPYLYTLIGTLIEDYINSSNRVGLMDSLTFSLHGVRFSLDFTTC